MNRLYVMAARPGWEECVADRDEYMYIVTHKGGTTEDAKEKVAQFHTSLTGDKITKGDLSVNCFQDNAPGDWDILKLINLNYGS